MNIDKTLTKDQINTSLEVIRGLKLAYKATGKECYRYKALNCLDALKWELKRYKYESSKNYILC